MHPPLKPINPRQNLEQTKKHCQKMVKKWARISAGAAIIPIPYLDVAIDTGLLATLLPKISQEFGVDNQTDQLKFGANQINWNTVKTRATEFAGLMATRTLAKQTIQGFGTRMIKKQVSKYIPLGGQMFAATLGYLVFKKIAYEHIEDCYQLAKKQQNA